MQPSDSSPRRKKIGKKGAPDESDAPPFVHSLPCED